MAGSDHTRAVKTRYCATNLHMWLKDDKCLKAEQRVKIRNTGFQRSQGRQANSAQQCLPGPKTWSSKVARDIVKVQRLLSKSLPNLLLLCLVNPLRKSFSSYDSNVLWRNWDITYLFLMPCIAALWFTEDFSHIFFFQSESLYQFWMAERRDIKLKEKGKGDGKHELTCSKAHWVCGRTKSRSEFL